MALGPPLSPTPLNGKIQGKCPPFLEHFPNDVALSIPAKEPPCVGGGGHFSHLWNCWTLSTTPPSISCIFFSEWDPPIILGPEFWLQTTKGNIAIHKIQRIPSRANLHLIILKREPHAYAGPTVSTFFQYRKSPPIIISSKLNIVLLQTILPQRDP